MDGTSALRVLGLPPDASRARIRSAYRALAKRHHPDRGGDGAVFRLLHDAYTSALAAAPPQTRHQGPIFFTVVAEPRGRPRRSFAEELRLAMGL